MAKEYRKWASEQKLQANLPILREEVSLREQARRFKMSETMLYKWLDLANQALLEALWAVFHRGGNASLRSASRTWSA